MATLVIAMAVGCGKGGGGSGGDPRAGKVSEAELYLKKIGDNAKRAFVAGNNAFPTGSVGPTPAVPCCQNPDKWCQPSPADWSDPVWQQLDFHVDDRFLLQYSYQSDGKTFTATATGDPECTGGTKSWTIAGSIVNGQPQLDMLVP